MKLLYKPLGMLFGVLGGIIATAVFQRVWRLATGDSETPDATDPNSGWGKITVAAAAQGAIFATVRAIVDRAGAKGFQKATGTWPG